MNLESPDIQRALRTVEHVEQGMPKLPEPQRTQVITCMAAEFFCYRHEMEKWRHILMSEIRIAKERSSRCAQQNEAELLQGLLDDFDESLKKSPIAPSAPAQTKTEQ